MDTLSLTLRLIGVAQLALLAGLALRDLRTSLVGGLVAVFCFGVASYLVCPLIATSWDLGPFELALYFGCFGVPAFFWLLSRSIFDDQFRLAPVHWVVLGVLEALGFWHLAELTHGPWLSDFDTLTTSLVAHQFSSLGIIVWSLVAAYRGRKIDLVEPRRRFRELLIAGAGSYMLLIVASEILLNGRMAAQELELVNAVAVVTLIMLASFATLRFSDGVFVAASPMRKVSGTRSPADQALIASLGNFMSEGGYRQTGLTIGALAERLRTREHSLRQAINGELGFRNFNAYLNSHRIAEAKVLLTSQAQRRLPVLTIAMDLGYGSLGPFNRAFKEATGQTPTEYRAAASGTDGNGPN